MVDALIEVIRKPEFQGNVSGNSHSNKVFAHYLVRRRNEKGHVRGRLFNLCYDVREKKVELLKRFDSPENRNGDGNPL